jgi:hypothetical protein
MLLILKKCNTIHTYCINNWGKFGSLRGRFTVVAVPTDLFAHGRKSGPFHTCGEVLVLGVLNYWAALVSQEILCAIAVRPSPWLLETR